MVCGVRHRNYGGMRSLSKNKSEILTRVLKAWTLTEVCGVGQASCNDDPILDLHIKTHLVVDKTFYMAQRLLPHVSKEDVRDVVRNCVIFKSTDPSLITWPRGNLSVQSNWSRIAIDVIHFRSFCYLSLVDCGPSRYTVWRPLRNESAGEICSVFAQISRDFGPLGEIVADN